MNVELDILILQSVSEVLRFFALLEEVRLFLLGLFLFARFLLLRQAIAVLLFGLPKHCLRDLQAVRPRVLVH